MAPIIGIIASANWASANASSYDSIATATGTGSSNIITFSSIPSTYKHLQVRFISRSTQAATSIYDVQLSINGDTNVNSYAEHRLVGTGAAVSASGNASGTAGYIPISGVAPGNSTTANIMGAAIVDIHDYASTSKNKTIRTFHGRDLNNTNGQIRLHSGLWISTSAINSLTFTLETGNFTTSSTIALYGIKG